MKKHEITYLKEKQFEKKAKNNALFLENMFAQNPIKAKFVAFRETKKNVTLKDLF